MYLCAITLASFFFFYSADDPTSGLKHARLALYHSQSQYDHSKGTEAFAKISHIQPTVVLEAGLIQGQTKFLIFYFYFLALGIEPRTSHMPNTCSTIKIHSQNQEQSFIQVP